MIKVELIKVLNLVDYGTLGYIYVWLSHHTIGLCSHEAIEAKLNSCLNAVLSVIKLELSVSNHLFWHFVFSRHLSCYIILT